MVTKSDASGKELTEDNCYPVIVMFDNKKFVADIDKHDIDAELSMLTLKQVVDLGQVTDATQNSKDSLQVMTNRGAREWAREVGIPVNPRGVVPKDVVAKYREFQDNRIRAEKEARAKAEQTYEQEMSAAAEASEEAINELLDARETETADAGDGAANGAEAKSA